MRHLLDLLDLSVEETDRLLGLAADIEHNLPRYAHVCDGKKIVALFYEPSIRARLGFESAVLSLGEGVLGFSPAASSSAAKGEGVSDIIHMTFYYADICAIRHPREGAPLVASTHSFVLVINAGGGDHQRPTQTLTDLMAVRSFQGRLGDMAVGLCGDLKFGHTIRSLINTLARYPDIKFVFISPSKLRVLECIRKDMLVVNNIKFGEMDNLDEAMPELDILYIIGMQKERFSDEGDYIRSENCCILGNAKMKLAKEKMFASHSLPRANEIPVEVDNGPKATHFRQVQYGVYMRMALVTTLLEVEKPC